MSEEKPHESKDHAHRQVDLALKRLALLYAAFSDTLIQEMGAAQGKTLIEKAILNYGSRIGERAARKARHKNLPLTPENFEDDLPHDAWTVEPVQVEGEERVRVHHCPLASEWMVWGDPALGRLYCGVDQAKMLGFNPDYEYVHEKNILDGDPYCELVIRKKVKDPVLDPVPSQRVKWLGGYYSRQDLEKMDSVCLRALLRERVHHTIEVLIYPILTGEKDIPAQFGRQPRLILEVWQDRGLPLDEPDIQWSKRYVELAAKLCAGQEVLLEEPLPEPFSRDELEVVDRLIWQRRSIRDWVPGKPIPQAKIKKILEAGRAAPTGCNLDVVRFVVIENPEQAKCVWSDIPTPMDRCVLIVVCYDTRIYQTVGHDRLVPRNQLFDCAAAADHMCLMAHALGLGAVWLTQTEITGADFKQCFGLPEYIAPVLHLAVGWPGLGTIKSARMPLKDMLIRSTRK